MEYILMALFGGGTLDWNDIAKTEYEWEDIFSELKMNYNSLNEISMNNIYGAILDLALSELSYAMRDYEGEKSEEFKNCEFDIYSYFETYCNYLDTHLTFVGSEELGKEIQEKLEKEIERINDNIGFTYIEF